MLFYLVDDDIEIAHPETLGGVVEGLTGIVGHHTKRQQMGRFRPEVSNV